MKKGKRTCVVIAGMHRSGTSALARVLNLIGCDLPKNLLGINPTNETGHWEPEPIIHLNDQLLESAGSYWDDCGPLAQGWLQSPRADEFRDRSRETFVNEFGDSKLCLFKEPRTCRLLPFWLDVIESHDIETLIMLPIRNPLAVADSLAKRDLSDPFYNQHLWLRHVLDAEKGSRGKRRFFLNYDELVESWSSVISKSETVLKFKWPRLSAKASEEVDAYISSRHRHHVASQANVLDDLRLPAWLRDTYAIMLKWVANGEDKADYAQLDQIGAAFDEACISFARVLYRGRNAQIESRNLQIALTHHQNIAGDAQQGLQVAQNELADMRQRNDQMTQEHTALVARSHELEAALQSTHHDKASLTHDLHLKSEQANVLHSELETQRQLQEALHEELRQAQADRLTLTEQSHHLFASQAARAAELQDLQDQLNAKAHEVNALTAENSTTRASFAELQQEKVDLQAQIQTLVQTTEAQEKSAGQDREALQDELQQLVATSDARISALVQEKDNLQAQMEQVSAKVLVLQATNTTSQTDLENLQAMLQDAQMQVEQKDKIIVGLKNHVDLLMGDVDALEASKSEMAGTLAKATQEIEQSRHNSEAIGAKADALEAQLQELQNAAEEREHALQAAISTAQEQAAALENLKAQTEIARTENERSQAIVDGLKRHVHLLMGDVDTQKAELDGERNNQAALWRIIDQTQADLATSESEKQKQRDDLAQLESALRQRQAEVDDVHRELQAALSERAELHSRVSQTETEVKALHIRELELQNQLSKAALNVSQLEENIQRLVLGLAQEKHAYFQRKSAAIQRKAALLVASGLLDVDAYKAANQDVAVSPVDPAVHYLTAGVIEGRPRAFK